MIKRIILISSLFLGFQVYAEPITELELLEYKGQVLDFKLCSSLSVIAKQIAADYYTGEINKYETEVSKYEIPETGIFYNNTVALAKKLPAVRNIDEMKTIIEKFEVDAFFVCYKEQQEKDRKSKEFINKFKGDTND